MLMVMYDGAPIVPLARVCRDFFPHLSAERVWQRYSIGDLPLPIVRLDPNSQKSAKGVALTDLADYLDRQISAARQDLDRLQAVSYRSVFDRLQPEMPAWEKPALKPPAPITVDGKPKRVQQFPPSPPSRHQTPLSRTRTLRAWREYYGKDYEE